MIAYIVDAAGGGFVRYLGRVVERGDHPGDDVVDIGEIAEHIAVIEHRHRLS